MHTAAKKLQSQRGASLIFALLVFMLCAFAGVAALVSAAANAGRYARLERDQQHYFSVSSSAQLLREQLSGHTATLSIRLQETYEWWYEDINPAGVPNPNYKLCTRTTYTFLDKDGHKTLNALDACQFEITSGAHNDLLDVFLDQYFKTSFLRNDVPAYFFGQPTNSGDTTGLRPVAFSEHKFLQITPVGGDGAWRNTVGEVYAEFSPLGDYGLEIDLFESQDGLEDIYRAMFEMTAEVERTIMTEQTVYDMPVNIDPTDPNAASYGRRVTVNTVTSTVKWSADHPNMTRVL